MTYASESPEADKPNRPGARKVWRQLDHDGVTHVNEPQNSAGRGSRLLLLRRLYEFPNQEILVCQRALVDAWSEDTRLLDDGLC